MQSPTGFQTGLRMGGRRSFSTWSAPTYTPPETVPGSTQVPSLGQLTDVLETERKKKYETGEKYLKQILKLFGPSYGKGIEKTALANVNADLISRGLGSTTLPAAMSVGMKRETEDIRRNRLADALSMISQYVQQSAPTPGLVAQSATGANIALREPGRLSPYMQKYDLQFGLPKSFFRRAQ